MPRITKNGPALSTATKLYLITSTVATGVGGGFFCSQLFLRGLTPPPPSRLRCPQKWQSCSYGFPYGGVATPPQCFSNGRMKVNPNLLRPCRFRKTLLCKATIVETGTSCNGKTNRTPGRVLPTRAGDTVAAAYCPKKHSRLFPYTRNTARIANEKAACFPTHRRIPRCRTPSETARPSSKIFSMHKEHHNVQLTENSLKILQSAAKWYIL